MARAALGISIRDLAAQAKVGVTTLTRFESEDDEAGGASTRTIEKLQGYFEGRGIEFGAGKGWISVTLKGQV
jgi:transcriptional regulator with XRE-family HTH domain